MEIVSASWETVNADGRGDSTTKNTHDTTSRFMSFVFFVVNMISDHQPKPLPKLRQVSAIDRAVVVKIEDRTRHAKRATKGAEVN